MLFVEDGIPLQVCKCRSGPAVDVIPTMKTQNERICLFLNDGRAGYLRIEDAERLQVWFQLRHA